MNIASITDTALAFQQAQFITIPTETPLFFFGITQLVSGKSKRFQRRINIF
jgi:hypothetical protein